MAIKAYFGLGARTFGNPGGATSGNGSFNGGGGGPTPTMLITAGNGGAGRVGYGQTFCGVPLFGTLDAGALPPFAIPAAPFEVGDGVGSVGPVGFSVDVFGVFAQNVFTSVQIIELGITLPTAAATFFSNGGGCGPDTVWTWALAGLVVGTQYGLVFV
jgi:hypothetical protein